MKTATVFIHLVLLLSSAQIYSQSVWKDNSPHTEGFTRVRDVNLEYLDWGGKKGRTILLLAGLGNSAHIFDDLAPKFTDHYHVVGLTRRGHGKSDKPMSGYDLASLVEDIRAFMDDRGIKRVALVGHSFAGDEMTMFATRYPDRVDKLVYLEAAYDRSEIPADPKAKNPFPTPPLTKDERSSVAGYRAWYERTRGFWSDAVEADLRNTSITQDGSVGSALTREAGQGIMANASTFHPDYSGIKSPVLAIYADTDIAAWVPKDEKSQRQAQAYLDEVTRPGRVRNTEKLRKELPSAKVVTISHSHHYVFIKNQSDVVKEIRKFLD